MAEYLDRDAAIDYIKQNQCKRCSDIGLCGNCAVLTGVRLFEEVPAADVAPVVHCKDCKYFNRAEFNCKGFKICPASGMDVTPDDFCSYADRRDSDST